MSAEAKTNSAPDGVPAEAVWDAGRKYWRVGKVSDTGALQGCHRLYRTNGTLLAEVSYVDGKTHGTYRKYHPNGEVAREGEYRHGVPVGTEVAYASSAATDEPLQKCCVPSGAVKLMLSHLEGGHFHEDFFDGAGRILLPDGSVQPERPVTVDADARYKPHDQLWRTEVYIKGKRSGTWRYWSVAGDLLESVQHSDNQVHGLREVWRGGSVHSAWNYAQGVRHGLGWELVPEGTYENIAIARQAGEFYHGSPTGIWSYLAAGGEPLLHVDLGSPFEEFDEVDTWFAQSTSGQSPLPTAHPLQRYLGALRQAGGEGRQALEQVLSSRPTWVSAGSERWLRTLLKEGPAKGKYLARLLEGLRRGAAAADVLCVMARLLLDLPSLALEFADLGLLLNPTHVELLAVRVLALIELGQVSQAQQASRLLEPLDAASYHDVATLLRVTFPEFGFWPTRVGLEVEASDELPQAVEQNVSRVRQMISKTAARLAQVRCVLVERLGASAASLAWMPPDVTALLGSDGVTLERYAFDVPGDEPEQSDHVVVDETLNLEGYLLSDLMNRARIEWAALCWLAFGVGLDNVRLPDELLAQPAFGRALTTAFARLYRVADQLKTRGYRARAQGVADAEWEGLSIAGLPERLLIQAQAEFSEMRAVLFFLADASCRSLWQDDLRG